MEEIKSRALEYAKIGGLGRKINTQKWGLGFYAVFSIDKVKASFFEVGKKGQGFDVWIDMFEFRYLAQQIMKMPYGHVKDFFTKEWKVVGGESGSKFISFQKGDRYDIVIEAKGNGKYCKIGTTESVFVSICDTFLKASTGFFDSIVDAVANSKGFVDNMADVDTEVSSSDIEETAPSETKTETPAPTPTPTPAPTPKEVQTAEMSVMTTDKIVTDESGYHMTFKVITNDKVGKNDYKAIITSETAKAIGNKTIERLVSSAETKAVTFKGVFEKHDGQTEMVFKNFIA